MNGQYEVLNPWAEVDPIPLKGIAPRVADLTGKTMGLFAITFKTPPTGRGFKTLKQL